MSKIDVERVAGVMGRLAQVDEKEWPSYTHDAKIIANDVLDQLIEMEWPQPEHLSEDVFRVWVHDTKSLLRVVRNNQ